MRLFIAIELGLEEYFKELQNKISTDFAKLKNVNSFHLTLKFLGDTEKLDEIKEKLKEVKFPKFKLKLEKIGVFPDESYTRVIWVGLKDTYILEKLQKDIEKVLEEFHFRKDFKFNMHVTLARVKFMNEREKFIETLKKIKIERKEVEVEEFKLIKSELTEKSPVYEDMGIYGSE